MKHKYTRILSLSVITFLMIFIAGASGCPKSWKGEKQVGEIRNQFDFFMLDSGKGVTAFLDSAGGVSAMLYDPANGWSGIYNVAVDADKTNVCMDASGKATVVWSLGDSVYAREITPTAGMSTPVKINASSSSYYKIASNRNGKAVIILSSASPNTLSVMKYTGAGWTKTDDVVFPDVSGATEIESLWDSDGNCMMITKETSAKTVYAQYYKIGAGWLPAAAIGTLDDPNPYVEVFKISVDGSGNYLAAWVSGARITSRKFSKASGWAPEQKINATKEAVRVDSLGMNNTDDAIVIWTTFSPGTRYVSMIEEGIVKAPAEFKEIKPPVQRVVGVSSIKTSMSDSGEAVYTVTGYEDESWIFGYRHFHEMYAVRYTRNLGWKSLEILNENTEDEAWDSSQGMSMDNNGNIMALWFFDLEEGSYLSYNVFK
jgi:hypothetical protein